MPREDAFSDVPYAARKYLAEVERKRQSMNRRSPGSGDEYVKGQVRASKGTPKRIQKKAPARKAAAPASKSAASSRTATSKPASKNAKSKYEINMKNILGK